MSDTTQSGKPTQHPNPYKGKGGDAPAPGTGTESPPANLTLDPSKGPGVLFNGPPIQSGADSRIEVDNSGKQYGRVSKELSPPRVKPLTPGEQELFQQHVERAITRMGNPTQLNTGVEGQNRPATLPSFGPITLDPDAAEPFVLILDDDGDVWEVQLHGHASRRIQAKDAQRAAAGFFVASGIVASEHQAKVDKVKADDVQEFG